MRPVVLILLTALAMFGYGGRVHAQEYYFRHYEVAQGLSHNTIHCATQDDRGLMWFGTKNGLNRFDGYQFDWYQADPGSEGSIGSNFIESIDFANGELWVGTDNGLYVGDPRTAAFALLPGTKGQPILEIVHRAAGDVWYVADEGLYSYTEDAESSKKYSLKPGEPVLNLAVSAGDQLAVATVKSVLLYQPANQSFRPLDLNLPLTNAFPLAISSLYFLSETRIAIGTISHGAFIYDLETGRSIGLEGVAQDRPYVRDFLLRGRELWIGTEKGIFLYDTVTGATQHLEKNLLRPYALSDNAVYCLFEDRHGGVWVGTYFLGLNYYSETLTGFHKVLPDGGTNSISGSAIRELEQDARGRLWIGTEDAGLNRYDPSSERFEFFPLQTAGATDATNVHGLLAHGDELWVGTFQNGLFVLDLESGRVKRQLVAGPASGLRDNFVYTLYHTRDSTIFALTSLGVHRYDRPSGRFAVVEDFPVDYFYTSLLEDSDGGLWAGTYWDGLFYYHPDRKVSRTYKMDAGDPFALSNDAVNGIFEDSRRQIWVTTENGLNRVSRDGSTVTRYGKDDGFPSNVFYAIIEDERGRLWISTANGLVRFHPTSGRIERYTTENGLLSNQFNYNSAYRAADGRLYFGGVKGFVSFLPYDVRFDKPAVPERVVLTGLEVGTFQGAGGPTNRRGSLRVPASRGVELRHDQSTFTISFSALDYDTPGLTEYRYQLEGLDGAWVNAGNTNVLHFTALAPGEYHFRVQARANNGDWSETFELLELRILPPWWRSRAAYLAYVLLAGLGLFAAGRLYHRYNKEKSQQQQLLFNNEKEKEVYEAKIEFFTNVSHEILTPLTLIKNPIEKLLSEAEAGSRVGESLGIVHRNTIRLIDLVQQLLDFRKTEMNHAALSFARVDLAQLVRQTAERFREAAAEKGINLTVALGSVPVYALVDVEAVTKIVSNLLQNAIKYGESQVALQLETTDDEVAIRVRNDGTLIPEAERLRIFEPFYRLPGHLTYQGTGIGLSLAHSLAELHGGSLAVEVGDRTMNHFVLRLPLRVDESASVCAEVAVRLSAKPATDARVARPTILLVEDNADLLDFVAADLREVYPVVEASSGEEALEILRSRSIQLIVSDVMMPGIDGVELCRRVKADLALSHIPVILLTSRSALNAEISGLEAGAEAYVTKPFSMPYLKTRVSNLLENRKHIVEHYSSTPLAHLQSIPQSPVDEGFLKQLDAVVQDKLGDADLSIEHLAERLHMSRSTLYRKVKDLTGASPNELISNARLKKAAELLKTRKYKVYEIAGMVGYNSATSFGRNFQKQFGTSPSEYADPPASTHKL